MQNKLQVGVVFGGRTVEHEISIISAMQTIAAIDQEKYSVKPIYISKKGEWYTGDILLKLENFKNIDWLLSRAKKIIVSQNADSHTIYKAPPCGFFGSRELGELDVIFPVMHGTYGEDGSLQGLFALMDIPYVGSSILASSVTMDKIATKLMLKSLDIPVLDSYWFYTKEWMEEQERILSKIKKKFSYPLIVKPATLGSSVGVTAVKNDEELENAIDLACSMSMRILVEPKVQNLKEVNCAVLGDHTQVTLSALEEPIREEEFLSYQDKYMAGGSKGKAGKLGGAKVGGMSDAKRKIPAEISDEMADKIRDYAKRAFVGLDCSGVARIDFLIDEKDNSVYLCELNPIPGSLAFYLFEPIGKDFTLLTTELIELALKRHREQSNLIFSYDTNILQLQSKGKS